MSAKKLPSRRALLASLEAANDAASWRQDVLAMVRTRLASYPCEHRENDDTGSEASTPPMSYDDWISCVVEYAREEGRREVKALAGVPRSKTRGCTRGAQRAGR